MNKLNVAMIGTGFMAKAHALAYAGVPSFYWPTLTADLAVAGRDRFGFERAGSSLSWSLPGR
jgi:predicted dehydrogenase